MGWGGQGLGEMKVHKSKLQKDKDAWMKAVSPSLAAHFAKWRLELALSRCLI